MATPDAFSADAAVFRHLGRTEAERAWLEGLPGLVERLEAQWEVHTGSPFRDGTASWAAPGRLADGTEVVLKVGLPHREARGESTGLRIWNGGGAPILYAAEPACYAVLMERCLPGRPLSETSLSPEAGLEAAAGVLKELWVRPPADHGLERVQDVCAEWAVLVRERQASLAPPFDPALVALGAGLLESLPASASAEVVIHGDANPTNFLSAVRRPWLAIDPKPMVGDPGYDPAPLVLQLGSPFGRPDPAAILRERFGLLGDALGQPAERLVAWSIARGVEAALWYASRGEIPAGSREMDTVRILTRLL